MISKEQGELVEFIHEGHLSAEEALRITKEQARHPTRTITLYRLDAEQNAYIPASTFSVFGLVYERDVEGLTDLVVGMQDADSVIVFEQDMTSSDSLPHDPQMPSEARQSGEPQKTFE